MNECEALFLSAKVCISKNNNALYQVLYTKCIKYLTLSLINVTILLEVL